VGVAFHHSRAWGGVFSRGVKYAGKMQIDLRTVPVYYINLNRDTERNEFMREQLAPFESVTRVEAVEHETGYIGCALSHLKVLESVKTPCLVVEDDSQLCYLPDNLTVPNDAAGVYLGTSQWAYLNGQIDFFLRYRVSGDTARIYNMLSTHAILYLSDAWREAVKGAAYYAANEAKMPIDIYTAQLQRFFKVYAPVKPLFIQRHFDGAMSNAADYTNKDLTKYTRHNYKLNPNQLFLENIPSD
jgi:hypothetical protein